MFGGSFNPRGFAMCNGQLISISQSTALFSLLGTTYGGNGQSTFGLPDFRGRTPIHQGQGGGLSPYVLGQMSGTESTTLTLAQMPIHNHIAASTLSNGALASVTATTTINGITRPSSRQSSCAGNLMTGAIDSVTGAAIDSYASATAGTVSAMAPESAATTVTAGAVTGTVATTVNPNGGSQPFSLLQPYLAVTFIICTDGIFPTRN